MSFKSWCEEFYPKPADTVPEDQAVAHSLQKWMGLKAVNLKKHGVRIPVGTRRVQDSNQPDSFEYLSINSDSCALCALHYEQEDEPRCWTCPLALSRDGVPCDKKYADEHLSPWENFSLYLNPQPMIDALEKCK